MNNTLNLILNCTLALTTDVSNEVNDTLFTSMIVYPDEWLLIHSILPTILVTTLQQFSIFIPHLFPSVRQKLILFFIYFLYIFYWLVSFEMLEVIISSTGIQICHFFPNCIGVIRGMTWFGESGLKILSDIYQGSVSSIIMLYIQYKSQIYTWGWISLKYAITRYAWLLGLGLLSNICILFIRVNTCKPPIPLSIQDPLNIFPLGMVVLVYIYLLSLYLMEKEDIRLRPAQKDKIECYYANWKIYIALQMVFASTWVIGTFFTVHFVWLLLVLFYWYCERKNIWWVK